MARIDSLQPVLTRIFLGALFIVWLSPAHAYLPVKMLVIEGDGARYEQTITRLELRL